MPRKFNISQVTRQRIALYGGLFVIILLVSFIPRIYNYSQSVGLATPEADMAVNAPSYALSVEVSGNMPLFYRMDDPRWSGDEIGDSERKMEQDGSLLCLLAMDAVEEKNPQDVCRELVAAGAVTTDGGLDWALANPVLAPKSYESIPLGPGVALDALEAGQSVLLKTRGSDNRALWLYLRAARGGEYIVYNPSTGFEEPLRERVYEILLGTVAG